MQHGPKGFYYLDEKALIEGTEETRLKASDDIILKIIDDIFNEIAKKPRKYNGYTLYAHNLGRFDSVFVLRALAKSGYELNGKWRDNDIMSIKITDKKESYILNY